ncbi:ABC transporter substrate-binding protein [Qipengyuania sp. JC766]|uniref:ABC transporter substrate-binding protein n=1 Tax=Qipengyuania sp. JC766 TaxID=3232139 RepID=UPI00345AE2E2
MVRLFASFLLLCLAACSGGDSDIADVAIIGEGDIRAEGLRLSVPQQYLRAATADGLVRYETQGDIVPALAERWIVTDGGMSYIFRLRDVDLTGGEALSAEDVRDEMNAAIAALDGTSLGHDLDVIDEIRAMTGRVIEIRLKHPMPAFLQLLAQPELALRQNGKLPGPMEAQADGDEAILQPVPPELRGFPAIEDWAETVRPVSARLLGAEAAIAAFQEGEFDLVLDGQITSLPLADLGPLSTGTIRLEPVTGLFGLRVLNDEGLLKGPLEREALAMAINRSTLMEGFNLDGWQSSTRLVPGDNPVGPDGAPLAERWAGLTMEQRISEARSRIAAWRDGDGNGEANLRILLPDGPGAESIFSSLARDMAAIGVALVPVDAREDADLVLIDRVARYPDRRWFLNQFNCTTRSGICSPEADTLVEEALETRDNAAREAVMRDAEETLLAENIYIPLGAPVRWSLVRGGFTAFVANATGRHDLFAMSQRPM